MKQFFKKLKDKLFLNFTLLRIWILKNIVLLIQIVFTSLIILTLTGFMNISGFNALSDALNRLYREVNMETIMAAIGSLSTIFITIGLISSKAKSIALSDLKSIKIKRALNKAGLYFDENGKLRKRDDTIEEDYVGTPQINSSNIINNLSSAKDDVISLFTDKDPDIKETPYDNIYEKVESLMNENESIQTNIENISEEVNKDIEIKIRWYSKMFNFVKDVPKFIAGGFKVFYTGVGKFWKWMFNKKDIEQEVDEILFDDEVTPEVPAIESNENQENNEPQITMTTMSLDIPDGIAGNVDIDEITPEETPIENEPQPEEENENNELQEIQEEITPENNSTTEENSEVQTPEEKPQEPIRHHHNHNNERNESFAERLKRKLNK